MSLFRDIGQQHKHLELVVQRTLVVGIGPRLQALRADNARRLHACSVEAAERLRRPVITDW